MFIQNWYWVNQRKKSQKKLILNENVSEKIVKILRKIVTNKEGTAGLANINGYEIAGKTGTAWASNWWSIFEYKDKYFCL